MLEDRWFHHARCTSGISGSIAFRSRCNSQPCSRPRPPSGRPYAAATKLPVILPITNGGDFARRLGFAVPITGIKTAGLLRCDQPRVLDLLARHARKVDTLPEFIMAEVLAKAATLFA